MADRILIVDDDPKMQTVVAEVLRHDGFEVLSALNGQDARRALEGEPIDVVLLDIKLPDTDGISLLTTISRSRPSVPVIMISGFATIDRAVAATKLGAYDFLEKPLEPQRVMITIRNALAHGRMQKSQDALIEDFMGRFGMVGASPAMKELCISASRIAKHNIPVLILGENGVGKEMLANVIHSLSGRRNLVCLNCAAIPRELIESELFGHKKGSFTGAIGDNPGKFQSAHGGTLFLDEIGDMGLDMQAKILRALETKAVTPIGSQDPVPVDARFIAATNKDLVKEQREGRFREDLYFRLCGMRYTVPPLRERPEDISVLAAYFLPADKRFSARALEVLQGYPWPGNVRELKHVIENASVLAEGEIIDHLQVSSLLSDRGAASGASSGLAGPPGSGGNFREATQSYEKAAIVKALSEYGGNITHAAEQLGIDRATLSKKIKRYGLKT